MMETAIAEALIIVMLAFVCVKQHQLLDQAVTKDDLAVLKRKITELR